MSLQSYEHRDKTVVAGRRWCMDACRCTREKLHRRDMELASMLDFVRDAHPTKLGNYSGRNIDYILRLLYHDDDDDDTRSLLSLDNSSVLSTNAASHAVDAGQHAANLEPDDEEQSTHNLAHALHLASIAMLGVLVLEVSCCRF